MKHNAHILFLIFLTLCGCQKHAGFRQQLTFADSLMRTDAVTAFDTLCALDSLAARMPEDLRMEYLLLRCNAQNKADSLFSSDSLGLRLTRYYDRHGTPNQRMLAHYVLGCAYRDMGDHPAAIRCFNEAVTAADTTSANCDLYQLCIIYGQIGDIYRNHGMADLSVENLRKAEYYAMQTKDSLRLYSIWSNLADVLYWDDDSEEVAIQLKEKAAKGYSETGLLHLAARVLNPCIEWMAQKGEWEKAKTYMDFYEKHSGYVAENGEPIPGHESYDMTKAEYYMAKGDLDSAKLLLHRFQQIATSPEHRYALAWELSQLYEELGCADSVAKYAHEGDALHEVVYSRDVASDLQKRSAQYKYNHHERQANSYKTIVIRQ